VIPVIAYSYVRSSAALLGAAADASGPRKPTRNKVTVVAFQVGKTGQKCTPAG
jgi:hypothetical protein